MTGGAVPTERFQNGENRRIFNMTVVALAVVTGLLALAFAFAVTLLAPIPLIVGWALWVLLDRSLRRACVEADDRGVCVENPFSRRFVPWDDVDEIVGGRFLLVKRVSGSRTLAWGVQNANGDALRGRDGYADEVARRLSELKRSR